MTSFISGSSILNIACVILISVSMSLVEPMFMDIENKSIVTGDRATLLPIYAIIGNISAAILNPIIGKAADVSIITSFKVCAVIGVLICVLFLIYSRNEKLKEMKARH